MDFEALRREAYDALARQYPTRDVSHSAPKAILSSGAVSVWSVTLPLWRGDEDLALLVALPSAFPLVMPRVYVDPCIVMDLEYPLHVGTDGFVCSLDPETTRTDVTAPGGIVLEIVRKARDILIEALDTPKGGRCYDEEFIAYWEQSYGREPSVTKDVLSLLGPEVGPDAEILIGTFSRTYGGYGHVLFTQGAEVEYFLRTLKESGIGVTSEPVFNAGTLPVLRPPINLKFPTSIQILEAAGPEVMRAFQKYLKHTRNPIVVFRLLTNGSVHHVGWAYGSLRPLLQRSGIKNRLSALRSASGSYVERISPSIVTRGRLARRTEGERQAEVADAESKAMVVGVGSIGSHIAASLASATGLTLDLVDPEVLTVENIGRHLLGLPACSINKAQAVAAHLRATGAMATVRNTFEESIVELVRKTPDGLREFDYLLVCLGDENLEEWLDDLRRDGRGPCAGIFYLWVEPHLYGGHCLFVPSTSTVGFRDCFQPDRYRANVLSREEYDERSHVDREQGCQTSFMPYSGGNVKLFVGSIMTSIVKIMRQPPQSVVALRWIGDVDEARSAGVRLAPDVESTSFGDIHTLDLGSR
jgi:hypothetical protein